MQSGWLLHSEWLYFSMKNSGWDLSSVVKTLEKQNFGILYQYFTYAVHDKYLGWTQSPQHMSKTAIEESKTVHLTALRLGCCAQLTIISQWKVELSCSMVAKQIDLIATEYMKTKTKFYATNFHPQSFWVSHRTIFHVKAQVYQLASFKKRCAHKNMLQCIWIF